MKTMTPEQVFEELLDAIVFLNNSNGRIVDTDLFKSGWREKFSQAQPPKPERKRWEYLYEKAPILITKISELGKDGWELCDNDKLQTDNTIFKYYIFKREIL